MSFAHTTSAHHGVGLNWRDVTLPSFIQPRMAGVKRQVQRFDQRLGAGFGYGSSVKLQLARVRQADRAAGQADLVVLVSDELLIRDCLHLIFSKRAS
jgi:hypothetical protein